ncbi:MAG: thioredoxin fold domain-containing protein [Endozoicomonadaceae bacterium]|nr:thioredoxin fold domain-containing protein [Endozoicomonadaceae bacterium]
MKKTKLVIGLCAALSFSAFADVKMTSFDDIKGGLFKSLNMEASLAEYKPELTKIFREKSGLSYFVFSYQSQLMMVDVTGKALFSDPSKFYLVDEQDWLPNVFTSHHFGNQADLKWITEPLDEGVTKTGDVYVVTDPTCGYCTKVDSEKDLYTQAGIQVHYIPFPRMGVTTPLDQNPAMFKWVKAACAENPAKAYHEIVTNTDNGKYDIDVKDVKESCIEIVKKGYEFGSKSGISGTPYIYGISVDGEKSLTGGYKPAKDVANDMGILIKDNRPKF